MEQFADCYTIAISDARCGGLVVLAGLVGGHMYLAHEFLKGVFSSVGSANEEVRVTNHPRSSNCAGYSRCQAPKLAPTESRDSYPEC